ncbi:hypothetical protein KAR91_75845 [Candidatus Pacearchaeota archaeon]|nr:hypothetical protein [Candidatus Pacearchaeota archaeon]
MTKYPRQRNRIIAINGVFDDFNDNIFSATKWFETYDPAGPGNNSIVTAPGAIGGYTLKINGIIANGLANDRAQVGMSPYANQSRLHYISVKNPLFFSTKAEFRLRIEDDQADATNELAHSAGFALDGNVFYAAGHNVNRTVVYFSVANGKIGIVSGTTPSAANEITKVAWSGTLDTWYDIRIEWQYDYYPKRKIWYSDLTVLEDTSPTGYTVKVYVNDVLFINTTIDGDDWRTKGAAPDEYAAALGRCGPHINLEDHAANTGNSVIAYYKDIWVTSANPILLSFKAERSILIQGGNNTSEGVLRVKHNMVISEGDDFQIWEKDRGTSNWFNTFRGVIREVNKLTEVMVNVSAEGYDTIILRENTENFSYTTQTAGTIIADIINTPEKYIFDTFTYFDATTATYTRTYPYNNKIEILNEMAALENFLIYLDSALNWHFQSIKSNDTDIYLKYGKNFIIEANQSEIFVRRPNLLRVVGKGVYAERELGISTFDTYSNVKKIIQRTDLSTQAEVDEALDFYIANYLDPITLLEVTMKSNHRISIGKLIHITYPPLGIINQAYVVINYTKTEQGIMNLSLFEYRPSLSVLISDLDNRSSLNENQIIPSDETATATEFNLEGKATLLISAYYQIKDYDGGAVVQEGQMMITDYCLDAICGLLNDEGLTASTKPNFIHFGTGTTAAKPSDTALDNQTDIRGAQIGQGWSHQVSTQFLIGITFGATGSNTTNTTINLTEIGLFNDDGDMFARAVFDSISIKADPSFRGLHIWLKLTQKPGSSMLGNDLLQNLLFSHIILGFPLFTLDHLYVYGTDTFMFPSHFNDRFSEAGGSTVLVPDLPNKGTFTRTKILTKHLVKYEFEYIFDWTNDEYAPGASDQRIQMLALGDQSDRSRRLVWLYYNSNKTLSDYDGYNCYWVLWIKLERGDINPYPTLDFEKV